MRSAVDQTAQCENVSFLFGGWAYKDGNAPPPSPSDSIETSASPLSDDKNANPSPPDFGHQLCKQGRLALIDSRPVGAIIVLLSSWLLRIDYSGPVLLSRIDSSGLCGGVLVSENDARLWNNYTAFRVRLKTVGESSLDRGKVLMVFFHVSHFGFICSALMVGVASHPPSQVP